MQITILQCTDCRTLSAPPHQLCPKCHSTGIAPHRVDGIGTLLSWTVIRRPPQAFRDGGIYNVAVVALSAGVPVTGRLELAEGAGEPPAGAAVRMIGEHKGAAIFALA